MFRGADELARALDHIRAAPADDGSIELMQIRPGKGRRRPVPSIRLTAAEGASGDRWLATARRDAETGEVWPDMLVTLMNARMIAAIAGEKENWPPAGDQFFVDLDLSMDNLPAGRQLAMGSAVIEITAEPHLGCDQFIERYGIDSCRFVNSREGRALRLRGVNCKVVKDGEVTMTDRVRKVRE